MFVSANDSADTAASAARQTAEAGRHVCVSESEVTVGKMFEGVCLSVNNAYDDF